MSIFSFLFGSPKQATTTTRQVTELPEEIKPGAKRVIDDALKLYEERIEEGYVPFGKTTIADLTEDEKEAIGGLKGLVGGQVPYVDEFEETLREDIPVEFTAEQAQKFKSPYIDSVLEVQKRKAQEDLQQRVLPQFEKQAIDAGGMSGLGSRAGVQAALIGDAFSRQLGDIEAIGQQKAYEDSYNKFLQEGQRRRALAGDLLDVGKRRLDTGLAEFGLLQQIGQEQRQRDQEKLAEEYGRFIEEREFAPTELARLSGFVGGSPFTKALTKTETERKPQESPFSQIASLGLAGLRASNQGNFGGLRGFGSPSPFGFKKGGSLKDALPLVKKQAGTVGSNALAAGLSGLGLSQRQREAVTARTAIERKRLANLQEIERIRAGRTKDQANAFIKDSKGLTKKYLEEFDKKVNKPIMDATDPDKISGEYNPTGKGLSAASKSLLSEQAQRMGAVGQLGGAINAFFDASDKEKREQSKAIRDITFKRAEIEGKRLELRNARDKGDLELEQRLTKEINKSQDDLEKLKANAPTQEVKVAEATAKTLIDATKTEAEINLKKAQAEKAKRGDPPKGELTDNQIINQVRNFSTDYLNKVKGITIIETRDDAGAISKTVKINDKIYGRGADQAKANIAKAQTVAQNLGQALRQAVPVASVLEKALSKDFLSKTTEGFKEDLKLFLAKEFRGTLSKSDIANIVGN
jgi:hypothetical protein